MLFFLPQRSVNSHLHGAPLHLPAITVINQAEGQRQKRAPLAPPHLQGMKGSGGGWGLGAGIGQEIYMCMYVLGGHLVNTACRWRMSLLLVGLKCYNGGCVCVCLPVFGHMKLCKASTLLQQTHTYTVYTLPHPTLIPPHCCTGDLAFVLRLTSWLPESACAAVYCDEHYSTAMRTQ